MRRLRGWWLLVIAATASAVVSLLASSMPALVGSVLVGAVSGGAAVLTVRAERAIDRNAATRPQLYTGERRKPPLVRDIEDPLSIGVHLAPPLTGPDGTIDRCPPYTRRDRSDDLERALAVSRFVLVVGESTAGKSRAAYEAMRACLPDHTFIRPVGKPDLPQALDLARRRSKSVIWLDDLDLYLGVDGLMAEMISPLIAAPDRHCVVLATMRSHERARYSPRASSGLSDSDRQAHRLAGAVLKQALEIRIERLWSPDERRAAADVDDHRIRQALEHGEQYGVSQYLAAGPQLFQEWLDAQGSWPEGRPRGAALVSAAVDVRRAGVQRPVPLSLLRELHEGYLRPGVRPESWEQALDWATQPLHSTSSLLVPAEDEQYVAFDYLADALDEAQGLTGVPGQTWETVVSFVTASDVVEVGWSAYFRNRTDIAERALHQAFDAGLLEAALDFSHMMSSAGRDEDVVSCLEQALARASESGAPPEEVIELRRQVAWWVGARYHASGDPARALDLARAAVEESERLLGAEHAQTLACRLTLARQVGAVGRTEEALALAEELVEVGTRVHGADSGIVHGGRFEVAVWTRWGGNPRRAVELWQELAADKVAIGDGEIADSLDNIEATLEEIGDPRLDADAVAWLDELGERGLQEGTLAGWGAMALFTNLAWWVGGRMDGAGDHERAREIAEWALEVGRSVFGAGDAHVLAGEVILAHQLGRLGDPEAAVRRCARVAEDVARIYGETHLLTGFARSVLSRWSPRDSAG
ncbi:hypothetical protein [Nonomuraea sp. NPDC049750]|uniref:hypothetical protein n=1 Tax=Nonomuraea sp. NPDC049750 TaxID=3154738 RepID=UPI0033FAA749